MEICQHSNISILGIKCLIAIKLKSMLLAFFLKGFLNCFSFLTQVKCLRMERKGNIWSLLRTKSRKVVLVFLFWSKCLCRRSIYKSISLLYYRLKKVLKGYLETIFLKIFKTNTRTLLHVLVRDPKLHGRTLWLDLRTGVNNSLHCPAVTAVSFQCRHNSAHGMNEVSWAERCSSFMP